MPTLEPDSTVQSFAGYLTEIRSRAASSVQQSLSEMSIIRDCITSNNSDLTEFKRPAATIAQQMQSEITDVREKLTNAFGEITAIVQQKTQSDQDMMKEINGLQQNITSKAAELETLKRSYASTQQQLQSTLVHIQNNLSVTGSELENVKDHVDDVQVDFGQKFSSMDKTLRLIEERIAAGTHEDKLQMNRVRGEVDRIHEAVGKVNAEFSEHKRLSDANTKMSQQLKHIEDNRRQQSLRQQQGNRAGTTMHSIGTHTRTASNTGTNNAFDMMGNSLARQSAGSLRLSSVGLQPLNAGSLLVHRTVSTMSQQ